MTIRPHSGTLTCLVLLIAVFAVYAAATGIFSNDGQGQYTYQSIRGKTVTVYGKGLYKHMSAEVAPQGIAQDYVTLFVAVPLLLISFFMVKKGTKKSNYLLSGALAYFLVTYLFYTVMGMYNKLFLVYVLLMGASFYSLLTVLLSTSLRDIRSAFKPALSTTLTGSFLIFTAFAIGSLWLSIVVPPLLDGSIVPVQVEHYTTLIVQGLDLGILLPAAFISGLLWMKKRPLGFLLAPVYFIFLSILMTALTAKVAAMWMSGFNVIPAIFIIPSFNLFTILSTIYILRNVDEQPQNLKKVNREKAVFA